MLIPRVERDRKFWFVLLVALAALFMAWPVYRSFLNIEIDVNEGWNAYFADAAMGSMPLYPAKDQLIRNNYPPLSFFMVGCAGSLLHDSILAGRLLSLLALIITAINIGICVNTLSGNRHAAWLAAGYYLTTMLRFFTDYCGMNDPQLLAHAVMSTGFLLFLQARRTNGSQIWPILIMILAGFIKHNIVAMPCTVMLWLALHHRREFIKVSLVAILAVTAGFSLCYFAWGSAFFDNLMAPRFFSWHSAFTSLGHLQWTAVIMVPWCYVGYMRRHDADAQLVSMLMGISLITFLLQKTGEGVAFNAQFDLVIACGLAAGLLYSQVHLLPLARRYSPALLQAFLIAIICVRLLISTRMEPVQLFIDQQFHQHLAIRERQTEMTINLIRNTPGDVTGSTYACYRAGKPFTVDLFSTTQRMKTHQLSPYTITRRVTDGSLKIIYVPGFQ